MITVRRLNIRQITKNQLSVYTHLVKPGFIDIYNETNLLDPKDKSLTVYVAEEGEKPVGLLVTSCMPENKILQIKVLNTLPGDQSADIRQKLLDFMTQEAIKKKFQTLLAVYPNEGPFLEEWEQLFIQNQWDGKKLVMIECFYADCQQFHPPWFDKNYQLDPSYEIFPWSELTQKDKESIVQAWENGAIPQNVYPFSGNALFEPITSLGLRHKGGVVAWVINRVAANNTLCYQSIFSDYDLQKKGHAIVLLIESIKRQQQLSPFKSSVFQINITYVRQAWVTFVRRRSAPYATKVIEYYQAWRQLPPDCKPENQKNSPNVTR